MPFAHQRVLLTACSVSRQSSPCTNTLLQQATTVCTCVYCLPLTLPCYFVVRSLAVVVEPVSLRVRLCSRLHVQSAHCPCPPYANVPAVSVNVIILLVPYVCHALCCPHVGSYVPSCEASHNDNRNRSYYTRSCDVGIS
jgi:hypothetical protein